jgi:predicted transcriptional regulator
MVDITNLVIEDLKQQVKNKGSQKAVADDLGFHPSFIGDVLKGRRDLSNNLVEKLGYERITVFAKSDDAARVAKVIEAALDHLPHLENILSKLKRVKS